jgi:SAM-dependent methyltransferase
MAIPVPARLKGRRYPIHDPLYTAEFLSLLAEARVPGPSLLRLGAPTHLTSIDAPGFVNCFPENQARNKCQTLSRGERMGFYSRHVLPCIIDLAMKNPEARRLRETWIPQATGEVLEVGIGSGLNLGLYSQQVSRVHGVDPSLELQRMARKRAGRVDVEFLSQSAENPLPLPSGSIDTVVLTWTLCSIPNPLKALLEMKRVLKADGKLIFIEHGLAPQSGVAAWQDRLTPIWKRTCGGCHLNRKIDALIEQAGFRIAELTTSYLSGPRPMTFTYQGTAQKIA